MKRAALTTDHYVWHKLDFVTHWLMCTQQWQQIGHGQQLTKPMSSPPTQCKGFTTRPSFNTSPIGQEIAERTNRCTKTVAEVKARRSKGLRRRRANEDLIGKKKTIHTRLDGWLDAKVVEERPKVVRVTKRWERQPRFQSYILRPSTAQAAVPQRGQQNHTPYESLGSTAISRSGQLRRFRPSPTG